MKLERWQRIERLFYQALEVPSPDRVAWLRNACKGDQSLMDEVLSLLGSDEAVTADFLHAKIEDAIAGLRGSSDTPLRERVGPYRLLRVIGHGGMGAVYEAERDDDQYKKKVAVKLVRPGMDTEFVLTRFRRERQILAHLEHPNIGRLLDGGAAEDGVPYLVMEYIEGEPITSYCERRRLSIAERLDLFLQVCSAVEYAHRNFVIHRDLKPGNILVDSTGTPKLLDFGISKLLILEGHAHAETATQGGRLMTPDYASPEQIQGEPMTIVSDIYSLGVILYELLTGQRPYRIERLSFQAIEKAICYDEVTPPSAAVRKEANSASSKALAKRLSGDLDTIVMKALQKEPQRRYQTAVELARDIRRHLNDLPISARPDTFVYRTVKFARRHRGALAASLAVLLALGAGLFTWLREAAIARRHFEQTRRLANAFVFDVHDSIRDLPGSTHARRQIVEIGLRYLDALAQDSGGNPELQAELAAAYLRVADVQGNVQGPNLGNFSGAERNYRKALDLFEQSLADQTGNREAHLGRLQALSRLGDLYASTRSPHRAVEIYSQALADAQNLLQQFPEDSQILRAQAGVYNNTAREHRNAGNLNRAEDASRKALAIVDRLLREEPGEPELLSELAYYRVNLGITQARGLRLSEALSQYRQGAAALEKLLAGQPSNTAYQRNLMLAYSQIGEVLGSPVLPNLGNSQAAREAYEKAAVLAKNLYEADPANLLSLGDYGVALMNVANLQPPAKRLAMLNESHQRLAEAARAIPESVRDRINVALVENYIAETLAASGREPEALRYYRDAERNLRVALTVNPKDPTANGLLFSVLAALARAFAGRGDVSSAVGFSQEILEIGLRLSERKEEGVGRAIWASFAPRAYAAAGTIRAILARHPGIPASEREGYLTEARQLLERSLERWQLVDNGMIDSSPFLRRSKQEATNALAVLRAAQATTE